MTARDARYGRRGGRWAAQAPGELANTMDAYRAAKAAEQAADVDAVDDLGVQLPLFDEEVTS